MLTINQIILLLIIHKDRSMINIDKVQRNLIDLMYLGQRELITPEFECTTKGYKMCEDIIKQSKWQKYMIQSA